jgi:hypothetical protein
MTMPRYQKGQAPFGKLLKMDTCHDIRKWRTCEHCQQLGHADNMVQTSKDTFSHGRCFIKQHGVEVLVAHHRDQCDNLMIGDLGVKLSIQLREEIEAHDANAR